MKCLLKRAAILALFFTFGSIPVRNALAEEERERPGAKEQAEVDGANAVLDGVYRNLMAKADPEEQRWLRDAQRAWIKWRNAEANYIARHGGAVGGSGMRVDYAVAELKLINERIAVLKAYLSQPPAH
jgi:uncharacterized protein YecT (DUF1311 family)